jgi:hypothetical protein
MNTKKQLFLGFFGLLSVVGIVVLVVLLTKNNGHSHGPSPPSHVPACTVEGGNGVCTSIINTQGKRICVGGDNLCGINLKAHQAAGHKDDTTCGSLQKYLDEMIQCNNGYEAYIDGDGKVNQGNCLFKCKKK